MFRKSWLAIPLLATALCFNTAAAERPTAPRLLPDETLAYIRVDNANDMRETTKVSGIGKMLQDEQLKPLVSDVWLIFDQLFSQVSDRVGVSLEELLSIPQGEVAFAVLPLDQEEPEAQSDEPRDNSPEAIRARIEARRNRSPVGFVLLLETGDNSPLLRRIIDRLDDQKPERIRREVRTVKGTDVVSYSRNNGMPIAYAEKEGCFVIGVGPNMVDDVLRRWSENANKETLAQNTDFGNVMSHCVGAEDTRPQMTFYADPYHLVERLVKAGGGGAAAVWPIVESLQLDKIKGVGGSSFASTDTEFEGIIHIHLLLDSPRDGFLSVVRPGEGSTEPEDWVPNDVVSYTTLHWEVVDTYEGIGRILGRFQGSDALERNVEKPFKEQTDLDLRKDVLEQLTGRIGIVRWNEPPMRINSNTQVWAFETKDIAAAQATMEKMFESFGQALKKDGYAGHVLYAVQTGNNNGRNLPENFRTPEPTVAVIGNYIVASDSRKAIEHVIDTATGQAPRLATSSDYALIAGEISGKLDARKPFLFSFLRGEEALRQVYEMARNPQNREMLKNAGQSNPVMKMFSDALEKNELPAFSAFSKYFAPSGGFAYDDPTGLHYATFTLRPTE